MFDNFYLRIRFKLIKFCNFERDSPKLAAPSTPISLPLIEFKINDGI
jgi:hypothetical protein